MMRQQRLMTQAIHSVEEAAALGKETYEIYGGLCHKFPVLVRTCGLCQTLAFIESKADSGDNEQRKRAHGTLRAHVLAVLTGEGLVAGTERYDDAIGRHYRAVELVAQTLLWDRHGIDTGQCPAAQARQWLPGSDLEGAGPQKLGLYRAWALAGVACPEMFALWENWARPLRAALERRNTAILAHGTHPVDRDAYLADIERGMAGFASAALTTLGQARLAMPDCLPPSFPIVLPDG